MTPRDRRALLAGGAVVLVAVLALRVVPAASRYVAGVRLRATEQVLTLARARAALKLAAALQDSFQVAAGELVSLAPILVAGATAAEAAANLTSELSVVADRAGLRVLELNALPDSTRGTFVPITLRGEFEGDVNGVAQFLAAVERSPVVLSVRSLNVLAGDPMERTPGPERLRAELLITGWRLNRPTP